MPRPWQYPEGRGYWWVGLSVIPHVGPGHRYLTGPNPGRGLGHGRIQRAEGTGVSVGWYVCPGRRLGSRCPGENRVRRESGVPDVTHRPLVPWPMASAIGQGTSWFAGLVYAIRMGTDRYGRKRLGSVLCVWVRLGMVAVSSVLS